MKKILVLRSGGTELPGGEGEAPDVVLLVTHEIVPNEAGIAGALAFDPRGARLIVSSKVTVEILSAEERSRGSRPPAPGPAGESPASLRFFDEDFDEIVAVGDETARAVRSARRAGVPDVVVPATPGAAGVLAELKGKKALGLRILWPRGGDADVAPVEELRARGAAISAPVVYEKRARPPAALSAPERQVLSGFAAGGFGAVAVGSLAALDAFLVWLGSPAPAALPQVRWGVLGPETARAFVARGLPAPAVPGLPRFADLIARLRNDIGRNQT